MAGLAAPWVALKLRLAGLTVNVGVGAATVNVTGIDWGVLLAPDPVTVIEVVYVPAASPEMLAVAVNEFGAVPERGESKSQELVELTLQLKVPVPELLIVTVCEVGLLPPCVAEKARLVGLRLIVGICGAVRVSVTFIVCGVFVAPVAVTVMGVEYDPAVIPPVLMVRETVPAPVPERVLKVSHGAFSERAQVIVPEPVLEMTRFCAAGLLPP